MLSLLKQPELLAVIALAVLLALNFGLRLSEMLALSWCDFENGCLRVHRSMEKNNQDLKTTKNEEERTIPCPPPMLPIMKRWRSEQKGWYARKGLRWSTNAPIVQSRSANRILQRSFQRWWAKERTLYPIPNDYEFHELRHTFVTLMSRDCGIDDRTTRDMSGHKSNQAFQGYTHTNEAWKREAASRIGTLLSPNDDSRICQNCKHWTASPHDLTIGACWANEKNGKVLVVSAVCSCNVGQFLMRMTA